MTPRNNNPSGFVSFSTNFDENVGCGGVRMTTVSVRTKNGTAADPTGVATQMKFIPGTYYQSIQGGRTETIVACVTPDCRTATLTYTQVCPSGFGHPAPQPVARVAVDTSNGPVTVSGTFPGPDLQFRYRDLTGQQESWHSSGLRVPNGTYTGAALCPDGTSTPLAGAERGVANTARIAEDSATPEASPTPEVSPEVTPTPEPTPKATPTPEPTPAPTAMPEPTPSATPVPEQATNAASPAPMAASTPQAIPKP
ncbi:MAG: hypothetical protein Q4F65_12300 [Propionibacteriaceae bacterium]|nr:hypothetical protein [Propionibacteriaceae bacterium]